MLLYFYNYRYRYSVCYCFLSFPVPPTMHRIEEAKRAAWRLPYRLSSMGANELHVGLAYVWLQPVFFDRRSSRTMECIKAHYVWFSCHFFYFWWNIFYFFLFQRFKNVSWIYWKFNISKKLLQKIVNNFTKCSWVLKYFSCFFKLSWVEKCSWIFKIMLHYKNVNKEQKYS